MGMSANQAQELVEQLIGLTERLTERIRLDTEAFEARRPHEAAGRIDETAQLANLYRRESARIRQDPSLVAGAPKELRARLARASEGFEAALQRHGKSIYAVKTVTEGVVRAIAEEVARVRATHSAYGPGGRAPVANTTAIALNRRA
jgi:hypothetical protein